MVQIKRNKKSINELDETIISVEIDGKLYDFKPSNHKGFTSNIFYNVDMDWFLKYPIHYVDYDVLNREIFILNLLNDNKIGWCPTLIYKTNSFLITNNCGNKLNSENIPDDYVSQLKIILSDLSKLNIQHNDMAGSGFNFTVCDSKLYLIDYGWSSYCNDMSCGIGIDSRDKPNIVFNDLDIINKIKYKYGK